MHNILQACPPRSDLAEVFARNPPVSPLLGMGDSRWEQALGKPAVSGLLASIKEWALREQDAPLPVLSDELYADFQTTGVRLNFERRYFERRRRLARAAIGFLSGEVSLGGVFLSHLEEVFNEVSWALPAHVTELSGKDPRQIDLFAAETANLMAECLVVWGGGIPEDLRDRIRLRLRGIFENYRDNDFWWMHHSNNWNAVCHQGVLGAALQVEEDAELLAAMVSKAAGCLPIYLGGFGPDGACSEGPGYWEYGFGWFAALNEQLETRSGGALSLFEGDPKIRAISSYAPAVTLSRGYLVNFSDCSQKKVLRPQILDYLGRRLEDPVCLAQAEENFAVLLGEDADLDRERADLFDFLKLILRAPAHLEKSIKGGKPDAYFPDLGVWVVRGRDKKWHWWELAAKGGSNDEHHNHNDVGNFLLNIDGVPLVVEIGAPEYTREFFSDLRYENIAARSLGHSLPLINGCEQMSGAEYRANILQAGVDSDIVVFEADLSKAYPEAAKCVEFFRKLEFNKREGLLILEDRMVLADGSTVESAVITDSQDVSIESSERAFLKKEGLVLELRCEAGGKWERIERHGYRDHEGGEAFIHRLVFRSFVGGNRASLKFFLSLQ